MENIDTGKSSDPVDQYPADIIEDTPDYEAIPHDITDVKLDHLDRSSSKAHRERGRNMRTVKQTTAREITISAVRVGVGLYMIAVTVLLGLGTYSMLSSFEERLNEQAYYGLADDIGKQSQASLDRTFQVTKLMASITAKACPDAAIWPNCSGISVPDYVDYIDSIVAINPQVRTVALNPFIRDAQIASFEAFAYEFYDEQGHGPNSSLPFGINSDFGKGIAARDSNGVLFHMNESYDLGEHRLLAPILMQGKLDNNAGSLMFNIYSETARVRGIDDMLACVNASAPEDAVDCGAITDFIRLVQDAFSAVRPAALLYFPIFPTNDPTTLVGVSAAVFNWDVVLDGHLGSNVGSVIAVISSAEALFSFRVSGAAVEVIGEGDHHNARLDSHRRTFVLIGDEFDTLPYTLHVYPVEDLSQVSSFATIGCIVSVALIVVTSLVILLYDHVVLKRSRARELVGETKRLFVRYVSHEIRTPLNTVHLGLVFLHSDIVRILDVVKPMLPESMFEDINSWVGLVDEIEDSADIAVTVLNDLINYDKIVMGSLNLEVSEVCILDCVHDTVRPFQVQARERHINMCFEVPSVEEMREVLVVVDSVKIEQVIRNLVGNALKFTPIGGDVTVTVSLVERDIPGDNSRATPDQLSVGSTSSNQVDYDTLKSVGTVLIAVKDSGVGMTQENLQNLFQEGVQFHANQLQQGKGSGLGLWVSKGFAMRHNGNIVAESDGINLGSTFTLQLPAYVRKSSFFLPPTAPEPDPEEGGSAGYAVVPSISVADAEYLSLNFPARKAVQASPTEIVSSFAFKTVLVVEDAIRNRKMLCRLLANGGYICTQAENGKAGLDLISENVGEYDLILMDFEMPVMDGPTATKAIRAAGYKGPIVGITGNVLDMDKATFMAAGANEVLFKPLTLRSFNDCIAELGGVKCK